MQQERVKLLCRKETNIDGKDCAFAYLPEYQPTTTTLQTHPEIGKNTLCRIQHVHRAPHPIYNLLLPQWAVDAATDTYLNCKRVSITFSCRWAFQRIRRKQPSFAFSFSVFYSFPSTKFDPHRLRRLVGHSLVLRAHSTIFRFSKSCFPRSAPDSTTQRIRQNVEKKKTNEKKNERQRTRKHKNSFGTLLNVRSATSQSNRYFPSTENRKKYRTQQFSPAHTSPIRAFTNNVRPMYWAWKQCLEHAYTHEVGGGSGISLHKRAKHINARKMY